MTVTPAELGKIVAGRLPMTSWDLRNIVEELAELDEDADVEDLELALESLREYYC